jgi:hypothetical protein
MRACEFIVERKKKRKKPRWAAYGPGPFGGYGYYAGYSGDGGGDSGGGDGGGESIENEDAMMGKIEDSGKIVRILKKQHSVPFSDEKNWLLIDTDPAKGNNGLGLKWVPASTRFTWVRPYRDIVTENMDHSKDSRAVEELKAALLAKKDQLQSATDDQVYDIIDRIMKRIARSHSISGQKLHDMWVGRYKQIPDTWVMNENFADGKKPGRKGLAKRSGVNTKASVSSLRKTAKNSSGEKARMAHWLANMKAGRAKKNK